MRGSLASPKTLQSSVYWTMSSLWAFQKWESCPLSCSTFRRERCRIRVTLGEQGSWSVPPQTSCSPHGCPEALSTARMHVQSLLPPPTKSSAF